MRQLSTRLVWLAVGLLALSPGIQAAPAADLWPLWDASDDASSTRVDHSAWQALLDRYLITTDDDRTLFRYHAVDAQDRGRLDTYLQGLSERDPRSLARPQQLPYWINLYNALTVHVVISHPGKNSILRMGDGFFRVGPWDDTLIEIAGQPLTLNDIEHRILRPIWNDRRIHYAVNCASVSCPNLAAEAYTADNTQRLLEAGEHSYLHHSRGLSFDSDGRLRLSSIYKWYVEDFGNSRTTLLRYLAAGRPDLADRLSGYQGRIRYDYDWALNEAS